MRLGVRGKLFSVSLLIIVVVGLAIGLYLESALSQWLGGRIEDELERHAFTARDTLELARLAEDIASLDPVADRLGASTGARITVIGADGTVLGDSGLDPEHVRALENHGHRPEVRAALASGRGSSKRYSTTTRTKTLYVAVPYEGTRGMAVVRVAMTLSQVDSAVWRLRLVLLFAGLVGLVLAVLMGALASLFATRALARLVDSARALSSRQVGGRLDVASSDELGSLAGSFNRVIDALDRAVNDLASERDHLETILESMNEGVLALDPRGRVLRVNHRAREFLGLGPDIAGQPLIESVRIPALLELVAGQESGERESADEGSVEFALAGPRHVQAQRAPLRAGGCVIVLRDVTRTRKLENMRRDFVANVSHELRTPVSVIRANAETLMDGALDDAKSAAVFIGAVYRHADRLARLISDLLDLSRIEAGEYGVTLARVAVRPVLLRVVDSVSAAARAKELTLDIQVPEELAAHTDARGAEQVLLNLVDNAVKYTPAHGRITLSAAAQGDGVRIEVADDGPGIDERHRGRIFERFYRVDPGRSREVGGTGLGLAIVKHLVESMGGRVGFAPNTPHGAIFWLILPKPR